MAFTIVFEGMDKLGKTTQAKMLVSNLREIGFKVFTYKFPSNELRDIFINLDTLGKAILATTEMRTVSNLANTGDYDFIVYDRFLLSTMLYQCLGNDLSAHTFERLTRGIERPNLQLIFVGKPLTGYTDEYALGDDKYLAKVTNGYMESVKHNIGLGVLADKYPDREVLAKDLFEITLKYYRKLTQFNS